MGGGRWYNGREPLSRPRPMARLPHSQTTDDDPMRPDQEAGRGDSGRLTRATETCEGTCGKGKAWGSGLCWSFTAQNRNADTNVAKLPLTT
jgi:hypothetical protein